MLQIVWLYRRTFISVTALLFVALTIVITFSLPNQRATVQSSIEIGSAVIKAKQEPIEPPEMVAKLIPSVYAPAALLELASKGTSPLILSALQNPSVESIGRTIVVASIVEPNAENEAKEFQLTIANQIIKRQAQRLQVLRDGHAEQIAAATRISKLLEQEISDDVNELTRISTLSGDLQGQIENQRENLASLYQRSGTVQQPNERSTLEAQIRESQEQISSQAAIIARLTLERTDLVHDLATTRRLHEAQIRAISDAQLEQKLFNDTRLSSPSSLVPTSRNSRWLSLLFVALVISALAAFGTVVLLHNSFGSKIAG
jgi:hypothetical protein